MSQPVEREYYLDALRSFCMIYGIFVHSLTLGNFEQWEWIRTASGYFRMSAFFFASAYLAGLMCDKIGAERFVRGRIIALGLPFLSMLVLVNPLALWLVWRYHDNQDADLLHILGQSLWQTEPVSGPIVWHLQLWFLVSLLVYTLLAPALFRGMRQGWTARLFGRMAAGPGAMLLLRLAIFAAIGVLAARSLSKLIGLGIGEVWLITITLHYLPFYVLGLWAYHMPRLRDAFRQLDEPLLLVAALMLGAQLLLPQMLPQGLVGATLSHAMTAVVTVAALNILLTLFHRIAATPSRLTAFGIRAIYTVYLAHYIIIYLIATMLPASLSGTPLYLAVSFGTLLSGFALHYGLVERSATLRLLFNGRRPALRPAARGSVPPPGPLGDQASRRETHHQ